MIVNRIYEWAKCQPEKTAVIWNHVSVSYLSFANAIRATIEFFQHENLPVGRTAIVLVHNLLDTWLIIMALRDQSDDRFKNFFEGTTFCTLNTADAQRPAVNARSVGASDRWICNRGWGRFSAD